MNFSTVHFGKSINDLILEDIENFFSVERIETDQIEFKSLSSKSGIEEQFESVRKSVCALLNSSGGLIIWGAPEGIKPNGKKEKIFQGPLTMFDSILEKDFIVSKISDGITPLPNQIRIKILVKSGKSNLIIEVDQSDYSPHQTKNTYYMRIDGQSKPAPHHYVEALFRKIRYPNIEALFKLRSADILQGKYYRISFSIFFFNWSPLQNEEQLSYKMISEVGRFEMVKSHQHYDRNFHEYSLENAKDIFHYGESLLDSQVLLFDPYDLQKTQNKGDLYFTFGGRYSPRKRSDITFDFRKFPPVNLNSLIIERKENKLVKEIQDELGSNKESIIKALLGRP